MNLKRFGNWLDLFTLRAGWGSFVVLVPFFAITGADPASYTATQWTALLLWVWIAGADKFKQLPVNWCAERAPAEYQQQHEQENRVAQWCPRTEAGTSNAEHQPDEHENPENKLE
jgi:hypothetical protein